MYESIQCYPSVYLLCSPVGESGKYLAWQFKKPTFLTLSIVGGLSLTARASNTSWERRSRSNPTGKICPTPSNEVQNKLHIFSFPLKKMSENARVFRYWCFEHKADLEAMFSGSNSQVDLLPRLLLRSSLSDEFPQFRLRAQHAVNHPDRQLTCSTHMQKKIIKKITLLKT